MNSSMAPIFIVPCHKTMGNSRLSLVEQLKQRKKEKAQEMLLPVATKFTYMAFSKACFMHLCTYFWKRTERTGLENC
jgi:hypothetical protein